MSRQAKYKAEYVIKGLECCAADCVNWCPYENIEAEGWNCTTLLCRDALELLKAQAPRVMTYDELSTFDGAFLIESCDISQLDWVFFFDTDIKSDAIWVEGFDGERYVVYREYYGAYTRCWTSRPTDEQREKTPWEGGRREND